MFCWCLRYREAILFWISMDLMWKKRCNLKNGTTPTVCANRTQWQWWNNRTMLSTSYRVAKHWMCVSGERTRSRHIVTNDTNWMHSCANEKSKLNSNLAINWICNSTQDSLIRNYPRFTFVHSFTRTEYIRGDERKKVSLQGDTSSNEKFKQIILRFHHSEAIYGNRFSPIRSNIVLFS